MCKNPLSRRKEKSSRKKERKRSLFTLNCKHLVSDGNCAKEKIQKKIKSELLSCNTFPFHYKLIGSSSTLDFLVILLVELLQ